MVSVSAWYQSVYCLLFNVIPVSVVLLSWSGIPVRSAPVSALLVSGVSPSATFLSLVSLFCVCEYNIVECGNSDCGVIKCGPGECDITECGVSECIVTIHSNYSTMDCYREIWSLNTNYPTQIEIMGVTVGGDFR